MLLLSKSLERFRWMCLTRASKVDKLKIADHLVSKFHVTRFYMYRGRLDLRTAPRRGRIRRTLTVNSLMNFLPQATHPLPPPSKKKHNLTPISGFPLNPKPSPQSWSKEEAIRIPISVSFRYCKLRWPTCPGDSSRQGFSFQGFRAYC